MPSVCFYFQVHQPRRLKRYRIFDIGHDPLYFNDRSEGKLNNRKIVEKVATKSYLPANAIMLELLERHPDFKIRMPFQKFQHNRICGKIGFCRDFFNNFAIIELPLRTVIEIQRVVADIKNAIAFEAPRLMDLEVEADGGHG